MSAQHTPGPWMAELETEGSFLHHHQQENHMETTEQAIQAAGADKAPRVTPADIEANISQENYFNAWQAAFDAQTHMPDPALKLLTFCVLVLRNGFTVTGESACASPENFNAEIGRRIARENAVAKIWPLMGYELRTRVSNAITCGVPVLVGDYTAK